VLIRFIGNEEYLLKIFISSSQFQYDKNFFQITVIDTDLNERLDMLIDFSDVLQICVYELGRTYLRLSQALCINIPSIGEYCYNLRQLRSIQSIASRQVEKNIPSVIIKSHSII
jgi:hypothetical protein